jgi:CheY-like chemotaxis protein
MPRMNGYEACRLIRTQEWGRNMLLVALTGWGQATDRARSQEAGFDHHFVKPVDPKVLLRYLDKHSAKREELRSRRAG